MLFMSYRARRASLSPQPPVRQKPFVSDLYPGARIVSGVVFCARSDVHTRVCDPRQGPERTQLASPCEHPTHARLRHAVLHPCSRPRFVGGRAEHDRTGVAGRLRAASPSTAVCQDKERAAASFALQSGGAKSGGEPDKAGANCKDRKGRFGLARVQVSRTPVVPLASPFKLKIEHTRRALWNDVLVDIFGCGVEIYLKHIRAADPIVENPCFKGYSGPSGWEFFRQTPHLFPSNPPLISFNPPTRSGRLSSRQKSRAGRYGAVP